MIYTTGATKAKQSALGRNWYPLYGVAQVIKDSLILRLLLLAFFPLAAAVVAHVSSSESHI